MKAKNSLRSREIGNSNTVKILKGFLEGREQILLVFIFGSFATRRITSYSDIDIAILFESLPDVYETNQLRDELTELLNRDTDVIVLNNASPILRMQVLKKGVLILSKERRYFHQFFVDTVNQYDDLKRIRKNCEDSILRGRIHA
jgi:predicted nucleotidyltransferase